MHDFADELEFCGNIDDEQVMCDAVDEYERLNQVGQTISLLSQSQYKRPEVTTTR